MGVEEPRISRSLDAHCSLSQLLTDIFRFFISSKVTGNDENLQVLKFVIIKMYDSP